MAAYTTIDDPSAYMKVQLYTGDGSVQAITFDDTDTDMEPDFVWIKNRDATDDHNWFDSVRGVTKLINQAGRAAETTDTDTLTVFGSDGFTVGADVKVNTDTEKYVAWCMKAETTGSGTTGGEGDAKDYSYSVNTTAGFSIVKYEANGSGGHTIPHHLGTVPSLFMLRNLERVADTLQYHHKLSASPGEVFLYLNGTNSIGSSIIRFHNTAPTSSVFTVGTAPDSNQDGEEFIAYLWTGKQGYSKFGTYEGNGNADGTFVFCGFRPALIITKSFDSTSSWHMFDNKREGYNVDNDALVSEATTAEVTTDMIDILSNGFKFRITTDPNVAETYTFIAFAEAPFVNSNGVPCNAR